jgi:hypothetical protein
MEMQQGICLVRNSATTSLFMAFKAGNREIRVIPTILIHYGAIVIADKL